MMTNFMSKKAPLLIIIILLTVQCIPLVSGIGLAPPQLRLENAPMGEQKKVATLVVSNTDSDEPVYLVLKISCLEKNRSHKLRVICDGCNRDVGIQRGDLVHPAKIIEINGLEKTVEYLDGKKTTYFVNTSYNGTEQYAIGDYVLVFFPKENEIVFKEINAIEALLNKGYCPFCGSDDLIFYDFPPDDILANVTLSCLNYPLEPYEGMYKTIGRVPKGSPANIDISVSIPDKKEYYGKYWEIRIMATSASNLDDLSGFIIYGAETKFLVDTPEWVEPIIAPSGNSAIMVGMAFVAIICIGIISYAILLKKKEKKPIALSGKKQKRDLLKEGRKIL